MAEEVASEKESFLKKLGVGAWIGIAVAALVIGVIVGHFALGGGGAGGTLGKTSLTEAELNATVATYVYGGKSQTITAREVLEQSTTLDAAKNDEGNYAVPAADAILTVARNKVIIAEADSRNITVSDEELSKYAEETLGSSDIASIASSYSMDEEMVKTLLRQSCQMSKLRSEVVTAETPEAPEAPTAPEVATTDADGNALSDEAAAAAKEEANKKETAEYAQYIAKLAGDEWDESAGKFKSASGPYATALTDYKVTKDAASYEAAQAAYYVAYQAYSTAQSEVSTQWTDFVNGLLSKSSISISTLIS
ncbi:MAG: hypothetical protein Q4B54_07880 [Coriobacteriales bacterium]|nr:hypothetical protein [Coriobacteriales bacterium]